MIQIKINVSIDKTLLREFFVNLDYNSKYIEKAFDVSINHEIDGIEIKGNDVNAMSAELAVNNVLNKIEKEASIDDQSLRYIVNMIKKGKNPDSKMLYGHPVAITYDGKSVKPKTMGQKLYIDEISNKDIVFGIGPAGTGKTYLAVAKAVTAFREKEVNRIILTRPAVEAGESLGFLPGDLNKKIDPYLRPLYDGLFEIMGYENYLKLIESGIIEVAPLAYMRGRTLDNAFVILDEAQNTTPEQMKMFLTRLGYGSKAVITGDVTQVDLPRGKKSGLVIIEEILKEVEDISFIHLTSDDIVRHPLVQKIIDAYDKYEEEK